MKCDDNDVIQITDTRRKEKERDVNRRVNLFLWSYFAGGVGLYIWNPTRPSFSVNFYSSLRYLNVSVLSTYLFSQISVCILVALSSVTSVPLVNLVFAHLFFFFFFWYFETTLLFNLYRKILPFYHTRKNWLILVCDISCLPLSLSLWKNQLIENFILKCWLLSLLIKGYHIVFRFLQWKTTSRLK